MSNNKVSRRNFLKMTGAAGGALALGGVPGLKSAGSIARRAQKKSVSVLVVGDPYATALETVAKQFTDKTGIEVKLESLGYPQLQARLVNAFLTKTADADVVTVDQMWTGQYADNNWILPLDDKIKADSDTKFSDFIPQVLYSQSTWRGKVWTLPIAAYAQGIMYRTDLFKQLGIDTLPATVADAKDWTWDKYLGIVEKLNGKEMGGKKFFGTTLIGAQPVPVVHMYTQLAASYGTRWFKNFPEVNSKGVWDFNPTINSPENLAALKDWVKLYKLAPPECINYLWFDAGTRFSQGDIGMFFHWTPYFYLVNNEGYLSGKPSPVVDKFKTAVLPVKKAGDKPVVSLGGWSLAIPSSSTNQDTAWQFIKWATGAEGQKAMGQANTKGFQFADFPRQSLYQDADLRKIYPFLDTQLEMMNLGNGKIVRPGIPIYTSLEGVYGLQLNSVMSGAATPEVALQMTDTLFKNILSGNQYIPEYQVQSYDDTLDSTVALIKKLSS